MTICRPYWQFIPAPVISPMDWLMLSLMTSQSQLIQIVDLSYS